VDDIGAADARPGPSCGVRWAAQPNALTWDIHAHGRLVSSILGGEFEIATEPGLARRLAPLAETGSHLLLDLAGVQFCDCAGVQFCDCAGLSVILRLRRRVILDRRLAAPDGACRPG
jgi:anti-anti-sigma regulatory factor